MLLAAFTLPQSPQNIINSKGTINEKQIQLKDRFSIAYISPGPLRRGWNTDNDTRLHVPPP
jgi:hypothetical protein